MNTEIFNPISGFVSEALLPTKANAEAVGRLIARQCREGIVKPLETIARLRAAIHAAEAALSEIQTDCIDEVTQHGKGGASILGATIEVVEAGVKYDFQGCPKWKEAKAKEDEAAAVRKDREKLLKTLSKPMAETDMETGEVIEVLPPVKTSTTTLKVTLGKGEIAPSLLIAQREEGCTMISQG